MIDALMQAAASFTPEQYLWWTRLQCIAWTSADAVIVFALIRLANAARALQGKPPHLFPYLLLGFSLIFAPLVFIAPTGRLVFFLELLITVPHFLLILYVLAVNRNTLVATVTMLRHSCEGRNLGTRVPPLEG